MSVKRSQELSQADQHSPTQISFPSQKTVRGQYWVDCIGEKRIVGEKIKYYFCS